MENINDGIQYLVTEWQLVDIRPFIRTSATNNYVAIVYSQRYKSDVALKVGSKNVIKLEQQALQIFQGSNCVKLINFDEEKNGLLLESIQPGMSLKDLFLGGQEEKAIRIFADVVKKLHEGENRFELNKFKTVAQRLDLLHRFQSNKIPNRLLDKSRKISDRLVQTQGQMYLLHGDLHHENILQRGDEWVIIDPQAVVGELEYEVGIFMCNPMFTLLQQQNFLQFIENRFDVVSELLNFDKQRLIDWSFVQAVLAACYSEQDGQEDALEYFISMAEAFEII